MPGLLAYRRLNPSLTPIYPGLKAVRVQEHMRSRPRRKRPGLRAVRLFSDLKPAP